jgi:hypothetical protein
MPSQSHATAPIRPAATLLGPLFLLAQLRQSHLVPAIPGLRVTPNSCRCAALHGGIGWLAGW